MSSDEDVQDFRRNEFCHPNEPCPGEKMLSNWLLSVEFADWFGSFLVLVSRWMDGVGASGRKIGSKGFFYGPDGEDEHEETFHAGDKFYAWVPGSSPADAASNFVNPPPGCSMYVAASVEHTKDLGLCGQGMHLVRAEAQSSFTAKVGKAAAQPHYHGGGGAEQIHIQGARPQFKARAASHEEHKK
jgi:hypothetical protein